jgi:hypothetical protein
MRINIKLIGSRNLFTFIHTFIHSATSSYVTRRDRSILNGGLHLNTLDLATFAREPIEYCIYYWYSKLSARAQFPRRKYIVFESSMTLTPFTTLFTTSHVTRITLPSARPVATLQRSIRTPHHLHLPQPQQLRGEPPLQQSMAVP